ncbi:hypothetical protein IC762_17545 [Bradyrhizobium genosp. L]|uniref:hypothetical protein n=1 Tax=Bradyrhizobium genosp. L TaxID=83637 RepID=UPI0018A28768|nr:hypothetical protein [Bradyrhizobium genosp. L]QPF81631.1 hypothetical protein IC762_17545 [Bradyrhizobium genosp. L]
MLAFNASICSLRSNAWFASMQAGWRAANDQITRGANIPYQRANRIMEEIKAEVAKDFGTFPGICDRLPNTALMDRLDDIQRRYTANYH